MASIWISTLLVAVAAAVSGEVLIAAVRRLKVGVDRQRVPALKGSLSWRSDALYEAAMTYVARDIEERDDGARYQEWRGSWLKLQVALETEAARRALLSPDVQKQDFGLRELASLGTRVDLELIDRFSRLWGRHDRLVSLARERILQRERSMAGQEDDDAVSVG
jgi:hypothetical protein